MSLRTIMEKARLKQEARAAAPRGKGFLGKLLGSDKIAQLQGRSSGMVPPKMMANMASQASANMPAPTAGEPAMGGRGTTLADRGENTKQFKRGGMAKKKPMAAKKKPMAVKKMASGGSASRRADGCATKGKTKGRFV
jgi:hypothetical protein